MCGGANAVAKSSKAAVWSDVRLQSHKYENAWSDLRKRTANIARDFPGIASKVAFSSFSFPCTSMISALYGF